MHVLRSLVFYVAFYGGSLLLVMAAALGLVLGRGGLRSVVSAWCRYHRWCVEHLLGIEVVVEGELRSEPALYAIRHESSGRNPNISLCPVRPK